MTIGAHGVGFDPHTEVVVVTPMSVVVLVVVVVVVGHASPAGRGMQVSFRTSLSVFLGFALDEVLAVIVHLPGFRPFFFVVTTTEELWHVSVVPVGVTLSPLVPWHLPFTLTLLRPVPAPVQAALEGLVQSFRANVQEPFAVVTPSLSH